MLKKLRFRFVCIAMSFVTVMLCVILGMVIHATRSSLESQSIRMMQAVSVPKEYPGRHREQIRLPYLMVQLDRDGNVVLVEGYESLLSGQEELEQLLSAVSQLPRQSGVLEEQALRFLKVPVPGGQRVVFADNSAERTILANLVRLCAAIGAAGFSVFLVLSIVLARWAVRPVEKAWDQQKQFVADASHELKTPLTIIMTNASLLQNGIPDGEALRLAQSILTVSRQMRALVEGMLELARADNESLKKGFSGVTLSEIAAEQTLVFEPMFFENGRELLADIQPNRMTYGSAAHLGQVLEILLDNAIKYSAPGSRTEFRLFRQGSHILVSVASHGTPLSREDLKNIFKRFYRVDKSRSRDGSCGLGLCIAQRIVEEHGGRIWAESAGGVNIFWLQLPAIL